LLEWLASETQTTAKVVEDVEQKETSYTAEGNVN
jgi:hypothetical protein